MTDSPPRANRRLEGDLDTAGMSGLSGPGRLGACSVFPCKSVFYGAFVGARRALNGQKRRFPAPGSGTVTITRFIAAQVRRRHNPQPPIARLPHIASGAGRDGDGPRRSVAGRRPRGSRTRSSPRGSRSAARSARARPGRSRGLCVCQRFPMKVHFCRGLL